MSDLGPLTFTATIKTDGTIMLGSIDPDDFDMAREHIMNIMRDVGGSNPIVETECITPVEVETMAQRLAAVLLGGAR